MCIFVCVHVYFRNIYLESRNYEKKKKKTKLERMYLHMYNTPICIPV